MTSSTVTPRRGMASLINELPEYHAYMQAQREWRNAHIVYFAQFGGPGGLIKIGYTGNLDKRILDLGKAAPLPVAELGWMEGGHAHEQQLHRMFHTSRFNGEWFNATADLMDYINENARMDEPPAKPSTVELDRMFQISRRAIHRLRQAYDAAQTS